MKVNITCASCGKNIVVNLPDGQQQAKFNCPHCNQFIILNMKPKQDATNAGAGTLYGGARPREEASQRPRREGETELACPKTTSRLALLQVQGQTYTLRNGLNVVGRKATTSQADVQIITDDRYMSRHHAVVKVMRTADGSLRTLISNHTDCKHPTVVSGQTLAAGDEVVLQGGTIITMGHTELTYIEE